MLLSAQEYKAYHLVQSTLNHSNMGSNMLHKATFPMHDVQTSTLTLCQKL